MRSLLLAFLISILSSLITSAPVTEVASEPEFEPTLETDWTYNHVYQYAINRGGPDDPVALLISTHINTTTRAWSDFYAHDISHSGGVLTVRDSPGYRLAKRKIWQGSVTAYPWVNKPPTTRGAISG
jgi:hypothetical protein